MAQDSLGKKTHLACTLELFENAPRIWPKKPLELPDAAQILKKNKQIAKVFSASGWPFDVRSQQAYVHRFFGWLSLPVDQQRLYPTLILAADDSVPLRQCLWLDFVFGTPEAQRAILGLRGELSKGPFVLSPQTHRQFCKWVGISTDDNTRRGPFARWLEDAGLAVPAPTRKGHETSVIVELDGGKNAFPEAFTYGLLREFGNPIDSGTLRRATIEISKVPQSLTTKALMIAPKDVASIIQSAEIAGYLKIITSTIVIQPSDFAAALRVNGPLPAQEWVKPESGPDIPLEGGIIDQLKNFPPDHSTATSGSPFDTGADLKEFKRRVRATAFPSRVGSAYNYRCCITGLRLRSPNRRNWCGNAAHIVPHSGKDKLGKAVFGADAISNGLFLSPLMHWCFDRGWITLKPIKKAGSLTGYKAEIATILLEEVFKEESEYLSPFDNKEIKREILPINTDNWPSIEALDWHRKNMFDG
jgi:HNH endonuclease